MWTTKPTSIKFWTFILLLILVMVGYLDLFALYTILLLASIGIFFIWLYDMVEDEGILNHHINLWMVMVPITWVGFIFIAIFLGLRDLYNITIPKFNAWLNKK